MRLISGDQFKNNMLNKVPLTYVTGDPFEPLHKPRFLAFALNCLPISEPSSLLIHAELYFIKKYPKIHLFLPSRGDQQTCAPMLPQAETGSSTKKKSNTRLFAPNAFPPKPMPAFFFS